MADVKLLSRPLLALAWMGLFLSAAGCGGGGSQSTPPPQMTLTLPVSSIDLQQDGNLIPTLALRIANAPGAVSVSVTGLPNGISAQFDLTSSALTFSGGPNVAAGTYTATITATSGTQSATQTLSVVNDVVAQVDATIDSTLGVNGKLAQFMSTSFQIGSWTTDYFGTGTQASQLESTLTQLGPEHIRVQVVDGGVPMVADTGASSDWNFNLIDTTLQPVLASADHSPELQIGTAPAWMCLSNGQFDIANHLSDFAVFMANMVRYYNKGGFTYGGVHFQSPSSTPITWWGIFNEFNGNGLSASDYVNLYNTVVPAMLAVDSTIKLSALEFSDYGLGTGDGGDPMIYFPPFVAGATAQVNIVSTHFYSTCDQKDTDATLMNSVPGFAANVQYFYQELKSQPALASVPVWVTENNVNADYSDSNGMSTCNPGQVFVTDKRGTSAFFAAWRPYVFAQLGKAGNQALYHWDYTADQQYGEVDANGNTFLSYRVDKTLGSVYPSVPNSAGPDILSTDVTETATVEVLATKAANGSVTIMVVNHAVSAAGDNNGTGAPRTVVVETSNLGTADGAFSSATLLTIDAKTSATTDPSAMSIAPDWRQPITLNGYGVAFFTLTP
jgi:hypothetical protein